MYYERFEKLRRIGQLLCRGGGPPAQGQRPFKVIRPKISEDHSEVLREEADNLTLRADEVDTSKACINADHMEGKFWRPPLMDATGTLFAKEGSEWEELYYQYREMSKVAGAKTPGESQ